MSDSESRKAHLRKMLRARRRGIAPEEHHRASAAVCRRLRELLHGSATVAAFASVDNEIDLSEFVEGWLADGKRAYFPRVSGPGAMEFVPVASLEELQPGAFDIPEPVGPTDGRADGIEVFLVPAVGFDRRGNRLGFGGGFYDRALGSRYAAEDPPLILGVGYDWQVLDEALPAESWDVPMDRIVTDAEVIDCVSVRGLHI